MTSSVKLPSWLLLAKTFTGGGSCNHDGNIDDEDKLKTFIGGGGIWCISITCVSSRWDRVSGPSNDHKLRLSISPDKNANFRCTPLVLRLIFPPVGISRG